MLLHEADALADGIVRHVKTYVRAQMDVLLGRIARLEARQAEPGRDGRDGPPGRDGKDGEPGKDGRDGMGFDHLAIVYDGERGFTFRLVEGERIREWPFTLPILLDRGVYRDGAAYERGDGVSWAGSFWIAQEATGEKPDTGKGWRLAVKRGRDGKDSPK